MPKAIYITRDGQRTTLDIPEGTSLMRGAVNNDVDGIVGECGGQMMCATCHVYVEAEFLARLPAVSEDEDIMLEGTACPRQPNSRLSCQITVNAAIDGIVVRTPETQL